MADEETIVFTTTICRGEIFALAEKFGWGEKKRSALESVLLQFSAVGIDKDPVIKAYSKIDAWSCGHDLGESPFTQAPKPARKMGQNDMWIAAVAHVSGATLVTTDKDFDHLAESIVEIARVDQKEGSVS